MRFLPSLITKGILGDTIGSIITKYVASLDGITQYWQLSEDIIIPAFQDFSLSFKIKGFNETTFEGLLDSSDDTFWFRAMPTSQNNNFQGQMNGGFFNATPYTSGLNVRDGVIREIIMDRVGDSITVTCDGISNTSSISNVADINVYRLGRFSTSEFQGVVLDFKLYINGVLVNDIPLTNKTAGALQEPKVGNVSATLVNYTDAVWEEV